MLTFLPLEQIDEMASWEGADLNRAKEILAWELTAMVHGKEEADKAQTAARSLFSGASSDGSAPVVELTEEDLTDGAAELPALLVLAELCPSRGDARRNIQQGGVSVDGEKVTDIGRKFTADELKKGILLRRGKKNYKQIILK
jgi:tyrosyl-tRNA synthetase